MHLTIYAIFFIIICCIYLFRQKESFISNNANSIVNANRIVVSMTTSPRRISKIKPVIDCVMAQTVKPDKLYLNLPYVFKRDNSTFQTPLPEFIVNNPLIHINWCDDIGPATKILPIRDIEKDPETLILSIDDDTYYPPNLLETFIAFSKVYPDACITGRSFINDTKKKLPSDKYGTYVQLLEGFSGVLYKQKFLKDINISLLQQHKSCYLADDLYLSNELLKQNIPIIKIGDSHDAIYNIKQLDYGFENDALHKQFIFNLSNHINYMKCSHILRKNKELYIDYY